jgi:hypothetical protein
MSRVILRLDNWSVKRARNHPLLVGKKHFARGAFSAIFDGTRKNTVLKMTVDPISYGMLNWSFPYVNHRHFPRVVKNHSDIGEVRINGENYPIFLYEIERLEKLKVGGEARATAKLIKTSLMLASNSTPLWQRINIPYTEIEAVAQDRALPKSIRNAMDQLSTFCSNIGDAFFIDMHMANFMQRKNGELVISDPLASKALLK